MREAFTRQGAVAVLLAGVLALAGLARLPPARADDPGPVRFLLAWGKQGAEPGEFHFPIGIAVNGDDEVLVTDHYNNRVQRFDADGKLLGHFAVLPNPGGLAVDKAGNVYVSHFPASRMSKEQTPDRVTVYSPAGKLLREWGKSGDGDGEFSWPGGLAIGKDGRVYVADQTNRRVQVFDAEGKFLTKWGEYGTKPGEFGGNTSKASRVGGPQFVALDSAGNVYTTEASVGRVQKFTADGKYLLSWGDNEVKAGSFGGAFTGFQTRLQGPAGICIDKQDRVWVSAAGGRVQQFTSDGKYLRGFGDEQGDKPGQFFAPHGVAVNSRGQLYVVDAYNHRVQKFDVSR
jgi:DNA-binding beta-propeller fold protein YncE